MISRHSLTINAYHENQTNKCKLVLYKPSIHLNYCLKQLYISKKMEPFSYKGRFGITHIEMFKRRAGLGYNKWLRVISNTMLFKSYNSEELKNRPILSFQNIISIAMWSLVTYSNCFGLNLSKEQMVITH